MKFNIEPEIKAVTQSPIIGNVYNVRGGTGAKFGHMMVIVSIISTTVTVLVVNRDGEIISGTNYGIHYFEDKCPIAYCAGIEDLSFNIGRI